MIVRAQLYGMCCERSERSERERKRERKKSISEADGKMRKAASQFAVDFASKNTGQQIFREQRNNIFTHFSLEATNVLLRKFRVRVAD